MITYFTLEYLCIGLFIIKLFSDEMITYNYKDIFRISTPLMLGMLLQVLVGITDTAFLGRVGEVELGAAAIAGILKSDLIWCWTTEASYYVILFGASYWYMRRKKWLRTPL